MLLRRPFHCARHLWRCLPVILCLLLAPPAALAAGDSPPLDAKAFTAQVNDWTSRLDTQEKQLGQEDLDDKELDAIRAALQAIRDDAQAQIDAAKEQQADKKQLLNALGPAPAQDAPAETPEVAKQRASLVAALSDLDGRIKRAGVVQARADTLMRNSLETARTQAAQKLLRRDVSPFTPWLWQVGLSMLTDRINKTIHAPTDWWQNPDVPVRARQGGPTIALVVLVAVIMAWPIRHWLIRFGGPKSDETNPTYSRKVWATACLGIGRGVLPIFGLLSIYFALHLHGLLTADIRPLVSGFVFGAVFYLLIATIGRAAFSPGHPDWQLTSVSPDSARRQARAITLLAVIMGLSTFLWATLRVYEGEQTTALRAIVSLIMTVIMAIAAWPLTQDNAWILAPASDQDETGEAPKSDGPKGDGPALALTRPRLLIKLLLLVAVGTGLVGYYNLSDYIIRNVLLFWMLYAVYFLATTMVDELIGALLVAERGLLRRLRRGIGIDEEQRRIANFWLGGLANLIILALLALVYLLSLGVPMAEITTLLGTVGSGVTIGTIHISFVNIALGILLFLVLSRLTRGLQKLLEQRLLPQTRLDEGVRNSVRSAAGYIGMTVSVLIAVSIAGIDLTNIALIAGALSVGIGFGLQNVVNNFISGLIVLVERPVKVGDWVKIGGHEGTVKRINVRATEIETFKRVSVVVPNGDLISQPIVNYTFKNKLGRLDIPVNVAGNSDIELVQKILAEVASNHVKVLSYPQPAVVLNNFSAAALNFELRCFVANIEEGSSTRSELIITLIKTLREAGVSLPEDVVWDRYNPAELARIEAMLKRVFPQGVAPVAGGVSPPET